ncbi:mucin-17 [Cephus cinctus]|uniref:Mucin-17 n=1 Tax=Cephus cinctus TaxID=211228 RepID=A0AAJ7C3X6_CEPCN|nr:mucin-17 [Cephus cinctus]
MILLKRNIVLFFTFCIVALSKQRSLYTDSETTRYTNAALTFNSTFSVFQLNLTTSTELPKSNVSLNKSFVELATDNLTKSETVNPVKNIIFTTEESLNDDSATTSTVSNTVINISGGTSSVLSNIVIPVIENVTSMDSTIKELKDTTTEHETILQSDAVKSSVHQKKIISSPLDQPTDSTIKEEYSDAELLVIPLNNEDSSTAKKLAAAYSDTVERIVQTRTVEETLPAVSTDVILDIVSTVSYPSVVNLETKISPIPLSATRIEYSINSPKIYTEQSTLSHMELSSNEDVTSPLFVQFAAENGLTNTPSSPIHILDNTESLPTTISTFSSNETPLDGIAISDSPIPTNPSSPYVTTPVQINDNIKEIVDYAISATTISSKAEESELLIAAASVGVVQSNHEETISERLIDTTTTEPMKETDTLLISLASANPLNSTENTLKEKSTLHELTDSIQLSTTSEPHSIARTTSSTVDTIHVSIDDIIFDPSIILAKRSLQRPLFIKKQVDAVADENVLEKKNINRRAVHPIPLSIPNDHLRPDEEEGSRTKRDNEENYDLDTADNFYWCNWISSGNELKWHHNARSYNYRTDYHRSPPFKLIPVFSG